MLSTVERKNLILKLQDKFGSDFPVYEYKTLEGTELRITNETDFEINWKYIEEVGEILGDIIMDYYDGWNLSWLEHGIHRDILSFLDDQGYLAEWVNAGEISIWHK